VRATQAGDGVYDPAGAVDRSFAVSRRSQSITFAALAAMLVGQMQAASAAASSGLGVVYVSLTPSVCSVSGSTVTALAPGTCTIQASQAGNGEYLAAASQEQSFTVAAALFRSFLPIGLASAQMPP